MVSILDDYAAIRSAQRAIVTQFSTAAVDEILREWSNSWIAPVLRQITFMPRQVTEDEFRLLWERFKPLYLNTLAVESQQRGLPLIGADAYYVYGSNIDITTTFSYDRFKAEDFWPLDQFRVASKA